MFPAAFHRGELLQPHRRNRLDKARLEIEGLGPRGTNFEGLVWAKGIY